MTQNNIVQKHNYDYADREGLQTFKQLCYRKIKTFVFRIGIHTCLYKASSQTC